MFKNMSLSVLVVAFFCTKIEQFYSVDILKRYVYLLALVWLGVGGGCDLGEAEQERGGGRVDSLGSAVHSGRVPAQV